MNIHQTVASGCYPRWPSYTVRTGDPLPPCSYGVPGAPIPSIQEQMGTDPISKLAAAIERLADALERTSYAAPE